MQQTDGLMHCIENFACLHHLHGTIRSLYVSVYFRALGNVSKRQIGHKFCVVCGGTLFVGDGVYPPGGVTSQRFPPGWGGTVVPGGGDGHGGGKVCSVLCRERLPSTLVDLGGSSRGR